MDRRWFEMLDVRPVQRATWLPLRHGETIARTLDDGTKFEEFVGVATIACAPEQRPAAEELSFGDGISLEEHKPQAHGGGYVASDTLRRWDGDPPIGLALVLAQDFDGDADEVWHLHQDVVIALGLVREGDVWRRAAEGWVEAARLIRDSTGSPILLEMRPEFLSDYLSARNMALYVASYRSREAVFAGEPPSFAAELDETRHEDARRRFQIILHDRDNNPFAGALFMHVGRADADSVDGNEAPPIEEAEIVSETGIVPSEGIRKVLRAEQWITEWFEPDAKSPRVRGDSEPTPLFLIDSLGRTATTAELHREANLRWLSFRSDLVNDLLRHRGSGLKWHSRDTGSVGGGARRLHFGVNELGLLAVLGKDLSGLPDWEQKVWARYSVAPDGVVSSELLAAHMAAKPAATKAPEAIMGEAMAALDKAFVGKTGLALFSPNEKASVLLAKAHRFRAVAEDGLEMLAKEINALIVERIVIVVPRRYASPPKNVNWRELKSLQGAVITAIGEADGMALMAPLFGMNDLRNLASHIGGSDREDAMKRARIELGAKPAVQGLQLLTSVVETLAGITVAIGKLPEKK